jgi:hypothetical protein
MRTWERRLAVLVFALFWCLASLSIAAFIAMAAEELK